MSYLHWWDYAYLNKILNKNEEENEDTSTKDWGIGLEIIRNHGGYFGNYLRFRCIISVFTCVKTGLNGRN